MSDFRRNWKYALELLRLAMAAMAVALSSASWDRLGGEYKERVDKAACLLDNSLENFSNATMKANAEVLMKELKESKQEFVKTSMVGSVSLLPDI